FGPGALRRCISPAAVFLLLVLAGCASTGDVKKLGQQNQVQNQRLAAIEQSSGREIGRISADLEVIRQELRSAQGRLLNLSKKMEQMLKEQTAISEGQEKVAAQSRATGRRLEKAERANFAIRRKQSQELDAVRLALGDMEMMMKTSLAKLPSKTKADKHFREAFVSMVSGELDIAADRFNAFTKSYKDDRRVPEAKYRGGQAYFLMRKYDHAIVPFFELVDKYGKHKLAVDARWMLARSLEETGDLKLARQFYAKLIADNTIHRADATRRVFFINELYPKLKAPRGAGSAQKSAQKSVRKRK
ncbi:MAG: tetratricopeptide repeat protein, partial [SAR324 cluster bacterium]|nr:tetratricopeptide repeat protein [SAR324 cluster bacterium]